MKFEKFLKSVGTHGLIVNKSEVDSWLLCGGVGMLIPTGVNALGATVSPEPLFKAIVNSDPDTDYLHLVEAVLHDPEGKANDIIRIFETDFTGDRVGIANKAYGLLEKGDRLSYLEIEDDDPNREGESVISKIMVVRNYKDEVIGFITGVGSI